MLQIVEAQDGLEKAKTLLRLSMHYRRIDPRKTGHFAQKALPISRTEKYEKGIGLSLILIGFGMNNSQTPGDSVLLFLNEGRHILEKLRDTVFVVQANNYTGMAYSHRGQYLKAIEHFQEAVRLSELVGDGMRSNLCANLNNIAGIYNRLDDHNNALVYFQRALEVGRSINFHLAVSTISANMASIYFKRGKSTKAEKLYLEALQIKKELGDKIGEILPRNDYGFMLAKQSRFPEAMRQINRGITLADSLGDIHRLLQCRNSKAEAYLMQGKARQAIREAGLVIKMAKPGGQLGAQEEAYRILAESFEQKGEYREALIQRRFYQHMRDSLKNLENTRRFKLMEERLSFQEKEIDRAKLLRERFEAEKVLRTRNSMLILSGLLAVLLSVFLIFMIRLNRQRKTFNQQLREEVAARTRDLAERNSQLYASNRELERFTFIASHDIKEPIRNIISFSGLIKKRFGDQFPEKMEEYFSFLQRNARQMNTLIFSISEYFRLSKHLLKLEEVDLDMLIAQVQHERKEFIDEKGGQIIGKNLPRIKTDRVLLYTVLRELIDNGLTYNEHPEPRIHIAYQRAGNRHLLSIADNGIGISDEFQEDIFQLFTRLHSRVHFDGTGLGLSLCEKVLERLGGEIRVWSKDDEGSIFYLYLDDHGSVQNPEPLTRNRELH
ncbi:MAG: tetratricopeptide repeat protein [Bacteroidota bacterium]